MFKGVIMLVNDSLLCEKHFNFFYKNPLTFLSPISHYLTHFPISG
jgi:hypothetical protein